VNINVTQVYDLLQYFVTYEYQLSNGNHPVPL
jgi:hypothetical protein